MTLIQFFIGLFVFIFGYLYFQSVLKDLRKNVMPGDVVGIRFGDYVVNRKIRAISGTTVDVLSLKGNNVITVDKSNIYVWDKFAIEDEKIDV